MENLKTPSKALPKSSSSLNSSFSIRFNATDDSLDNISTTTTTPATTQQSNGEESSWKRDFLQSSFFSRKRSNSIENSSALTVPTTTTTTTATSTSSSADAATPTPIMDTTTWARFKGKVNQAMEDMKSSNPKAGSAPITNIAAAGGDSSTVVSGSGSDVLSLIDSTTTAPSSISEDYLDPQSVNGDADSSDNDVDSEIFNKDELESSSIKSLRTVRKRDAIKERLLRAKEKTKDVIGRSRRTEKRLPTDDSPKKVADVEIESGVEMVEEMVVSGDTSQSNQQTHLGENNDDNATSSTIHPEMRVRSSDPPNVWDVDTDNPHLGGQTTTNATPPQPPPSVSHLTHLLPIISSAIASRNFALSLTLLAILLVAPLPPFLQGVLSCIFSIVTVSGLYKTSCSLIMAVISLNNPNGPETAPFSVPDYTQMPVGEIPVAEALKSYCGWLNEINNYDPDNFHIGLTKSVLVKLEGTRMRVSNVANRVPRRSMWNEPVIDKKQLIVTRNRMFDLLNCRVEMVPKGLARKRHFNRKYPIQLIIPNGGLSTYTVVGNPEVATPEKDPSPEMEEKLFFPNDFDSTDFGTTILNSDTAVLQQQQQAPLLRVPLVDNNEQPSDTTPCGDEIRLLLFARCDREKEDWYRRFINASVGAVRDNENPLANIKYVTDKMAHALQQVTQNLENLNEEERQQKGGSTEKKKELTEDVATDEGEVQFPPDTQFDGLLMTPCSARSHPDYVKFMAKYQNACQRKSSPSIPISSSPDKKSRREKKEDDLWKGIDQSLFLGPTSDVLWANVLMGRFMYSCLNDDPMLERIQDFLQKKLSSIKLPNFMEDMTIAQLCLGDKPPLVHRVSQPLMDERGTWIDADVTYEGLIYATVTTKLNLLRLRKQQGSNGANQFPQQDAVRTAKGPVSTRLQMSSIYDSDAESTGGSSSESESSAHVPTIVVDSAASVPPGATPGATELLSGTPASASSSGSSRKLLRIVDKITASNLFQSATEISYVQRAMENMSTRIKLRVELKGLVARVVVNIPPPPSDRIWIGFRGPPRLWISAKPALGEHSVDWSIVTNVIENKLCEEVYKYLVYPNMVDVIVPVLGQSTYREE